MKKLKYIFKIKSEIETSDVVIFNNINSVDLDRVKKLKFETAATAFQTRISTEQSYNTVTTIL